MSIPLLTVTVTILVAVFVALMARQLKISEFRQAWIDGIRKDVSEYMSKAHEWIDLYIEFNYESDQNVKAKMAPELVRIKYDSFHVLWRIELRFKPDDREANKLLLCLRNLLDPGKLTQENRYSSWRDMSDDAVLNTRILLKEEWEATKSPFRRARKNNESNNNPLGLNEKGKKMSVKWTDVVSAIGVITIPVILYLASEDQAESREKVALETRTINAVNDLSRQVASIVSEKVQLDSKNKVKDDDRFSFKYISSNTPVRAQVIRLLNEYDYICLGANDELFSDDIVNRLRGDALEYTWNQYGDYISAYRNTYIKKKNAWPECDKWLSRMRLSEKA